MDSDWLLLERNKGLVNGAAENMRRIRVDDLAKSLYFASPSTEVFSLNSTKMLLGDNLEIDSNTAISEILNGAVTSLNGLTGGLSVNKFTEGITAPSINIPGDRWLDTDTGYLYTAITGASGFIWVQF
jgi:hypothetical protein